MKRILTPLQMKSIDEYAINTLRIPSLRLMENAGKAVSNEIIEKFKRPVRSGKRWKSSQRTDLIAVFCGRGNNGGDGFVAARILAEHHYPVMVVLMESQNDLSGDGETNYRRLQQGKYDRLEILRFAAFRKLRNKKCTAIVDAMLGTAFRGKLGGSYLTAVEWCNGQSALKIAVDIPTGLNGETGEVITDAFRADYTVTMSNPKAGFYRGRAKEYTGEVVIADIGIPAKAFTQTVNSIDEQAVLIESGDVKDTFPKRAADSHKHTVGKIFIVAGSKSMMGAAFLCSQSAMRSGAGQVIAGIPDSEYDVIAKRTIEVMPLGLPSTPDGSIAFSAQGEIEKRSGWSDVVLLGCGMSRNEETQQLIRDVIATSTKPLVIDADGLNALSGHRDILKKRKAKHVILTPHLGEFSRLSGIAPEAVEKKKYFIASDFAKEYNVTLVLKGAPTIVAGPKGRIFVNSTGNPGMSTAGSGDVLAGIIASFVGQGNPSVEAAVNGVYIHGKAGDAAAENKGIHGMIAGDIIKYIPAAIQMVLRQ